MFSNIVIKEWCDVKNDSCGMRIEILILLFCFQVYIEQLELSLIFIRGNLTIQLWNPVAP